MQDPLQFLLKYGIKITHQEYKVLCLWIAGESAKESASFLGIRPRTIEFHRVNVRNKFQAPTFAVLRQKIRDLDLKSTLDEEAQKIIKIFQRTELENQLHF